VKNSLLIIILLALGTACHGRLHAGIGGSGNRIQQKRDVGSFTSIATEGDFEIAVACQKPQSLEIEGDDNILPLVSTEVSNNVLRVRNLRGYSVSQPISLKISVPDLTGVSASGAGSIVVTGVKNDKFEINANGAPSIRAAGETKSLTIDANGAGQLDVHKLRAANAQVDSKGVATVEVYASEQLDVTVSGPSSVLYHGSPVVKKTIHGPGQVEKKESEGS
jgi:hypothetical protein